MPRGNGPLIVALISFVDPNEEVIKQSACQDTDFFRYYSLVISE